MIRLPYGTHEGGPPDPPEPRMKRCWHCDGEGRVWYPDDIHHSERCSICNGTREIPDEDDRTEKEILEDKGDEEYHRRKEDSK